MTYAFLDEKGEEVHRGMGCPDCSWYNLWEGHCRLQSHKGEKYLYTAQVWCPEFDFAPEIIG